MSDEGEFEFIARRLAPLSAGAPGAARLADDGAVLALDPGETLAVTTDTLIEGRHFPRAGDPHLAAQKALRANLSDLAAMGARPFGYFLNIAWPQEGAAARAAGFVAGLAADQAAFAIRLHGGDTTSSPGPWTIAVTMLGRRPAGLGLRRGGARPGDALVVTGCIGDAGLGLRALQGEELGLASGDRAVLERRSLLPEPRLAAIAPMRRHAGAVIDVSDGLLADARHLAVQSDLALDIRLEALPLSRPAERWLSAQEDKAEARLGLASGGDDYELLLSTPRPDALMTELMAAGVPAKAIGAFRPGPGAAHVFHEGRPVRPEAWGFTHF